MLVALQRLRRKWWTLITEVSRFSSWLLYMIINIVITALVYLMDYLTTNLLSSMTRALSWE